MPLPDHVEEQSDGERLTAIETTLRTIYADVRRMVDVIPDMKVMNQIVISVDKKVDTVAAAMDKRVGGVEQRVASIETAQSAMKERIDTNRTNHVWLLCTLTGIISAIGGFILKAII